MKNHILELVAIFMIGDGVLGVLFPKGHARLWKIGPQAWQDATEKFAENPDATRIASAAEILVGIVLAFAQHEKWEESKANKFAWPCRNVAHNLLSP